MAAKKKLLTIQQSISYINELFGVDVDVYKRQTIYNAIHQKRLKNYGPRHMVLLSCDELESVFGPKAS
jgi:hypothetical protein